MNKQIKELAKQAGWSSFEVLDERNQKFAELIVRECMRKINVNGSQIECEIEEDIKQHFGVKE